MSLFNLHYETAPEPAPKAPEPENYLATIKTTRNGQRIMVCTTEPLPAAALAEAEEKKLPLFGPSEIRQLAGSDQATVDQAIAVKLTMPGATVKSVILTGSPSQGAAA